MADHSRAKWIIDNMALEDLTNILSHRDKLIKTVEELEKRVKELEAELIDYLSERQAN